MKNRDIFITNHTEKAQGFAVTIPLDGYPADVVLKVARRMRPDSIWTDDENCYAVARSMGIDITFLKWEGLFTKDI